MNIYRLFMSTIAFLIMLAFVLAARGMDSPDPKKLISTKPAPSELVSTKFEISITSDEDEEASLLFDVLAERNITKSSVLKVITHLHRFSHFNTKYKNAYNFYADSISDKLSIHADTKELGRILENILFSIRLVPKPEFKKFMEVLQRCYRSADQEYREEAALIQYMRDQASEDQDSGKYDAN